MYFPHDTNPDITYVFATKGGASINPGWYHNLTTAGDSSVERGTETYQVAVRELTGADRDRVYAEQARRFPGAEACGCQYPAGNTRLPATGSTRGLVAVTELF